MGDVKMVFEEMCCENMACRVRPQAVVDTAMNPQVS